MSPTKLKRQRRKRMGAYRTSHPPIHYRGLRWWWDGERRHGKKRRDTAEARLEKSFRSYRKGHPNELYVKDVLAPLVRELRRRDGSPKEMGR